MQTTARKLRLAPLVHAALLAPQAAHARVIEDATGRSVELPDHITQVFPAGPPAAALLCAVAPQDLLGWTHDPGGVSQGYIAAPYASLPHLGAPEAFPEDIRAVTREFYRLFYAVDLTDAMLDELLP